MDISKYEIIITQHAFFRAFERCVTPDMVEATLEGGVIKKFGKCSLKFYKKYKKFIVVCVDQIIKNIIGRPRELNAPVGA